MAGKWLATRIESSSGNGVPDVVAAINGGFVFIELKYIKYWPKRTSTKVKLPLKPEQKLWISTRAKLSGGNIWVLCRIENYFFFLDYIEAINACEGHTKQEWIDKYAHWENKINFKELGSVL